MQPDGATVSAYLRVLLSCMDRDGGQNAVGPGSWSCGQKRPFIERGRVALLLALFASICYMPA
jgi:hypothetical protein